ncbi:MAG TPA: rhomboid family intramembrane serine protease [Opitutaceae bacterium]|nr:rhomboid family intramembrane serine protease [Opitutaceae bacterium]
MPDHANIPGGATVFEVGYDSGRGAAGSNAELKGRGQLAIDPRGPVFSFTGLRRRLFSSERITVELGAADIANATLAGRTIRFAARPRAPGAPVRSFVFHGRDEAEARAIFQKLPPHQLEGFVEARDFLERLDSLGGARPAWATVTGAIIAMNVAVFIVMAGFLGAGWVRPDDITAYIRYGANNGGATTDGEWWRLLTSMFMHYGILHVALNMWALFNTGVFLEKLQGRALYAITYLGSGLAGGFASILWNGDKVWSAGASGAVFGVIGGIIGFMLRERQSIPRAVLRGMMNSSLAFAGYNILFGFSIPGIDNAAHLGGLAGGIALGWLLAVPVEAAARQRLVGGRIAMGLVAIALMCAAGVKFTPRFDYRVADEIALREVLGEFGPGEAQVAKEHDRAIAALRDDGDVAAFAAWVESTAAPFFAKWQGVLEGLALEPGRSTAVRRDKVAAILDMKRAAYTQLAADLRAGRPDAFQEFTAAEKRIEPLIRALERKP